MNKQDTRRTGNKHSSLIDQMVQAAADAAPKPTVFQDAVMKIASREPDDLKSIIAGIAKKAQFDAIGDEMGGGMPGEEGMPGEGLPGEEGLGEDVEGGKQHIVDALIALCGGIEEAKACIDQLGVQEGMPGEEMPGEEMPGMGMPEGDVAPAPMQEASPMPTAAPMPSAAPMPM